MRGEPPRGAAVAAPREEAVAAGLRVMGEGGNAVDAAVAASFVLGVVEPYMTGLGALGEIVIRDETGQAHALDCAGRAPAGAEAAMFDVVGDAGGLYGWPEVRGEANVHGPRAVVAPRLVRGLKAMHERFGSRPWICLLHPAIELARNGVSVDAFTAAILSAEMEVLSRDELAGRLYYPQGRPLPPQIEGPAPRVVNEALAEALAEIGRDGAAPLEAGGSIAADVVASLGSEATLRPADFGSGPLEVISGLEPLATYRGWAVYGSPLTSGATTASQILAALDRRDDSAVDEVELARVIAAAFRDRLGRMSGEGRAEEFLDEDSVAAVAGSGFEAGAAAPASRPVPTATTHLAVRDRDGRLVAVTQTLLSLFGALRGVPERGFFLNNGMMWFDPVPGRANSVAPEARALSAVSPLILVSEAGDQLVVGGLGARRIISAMPQVVRNVISRGLDAAAAVNAPRLHADPTLPVALDRRLPADLEGRFERHGIATTREFPAPTSLAFCRAYALVKRAGEETAEVGIDQRSKSNWTGEEGLI
jgi:gamma-glutamyltranspeptidase/glutathione hydrolase